MLERNMERREILEAAKGTQRFGEIELERNEKDCWGGIFLKE